MLKRFNLFRESNRGFTLIELMVAALLCAAVIAIGIKIFYAADTSYGLLKNDTEKAMNSRQVAEHINNSIKFTNALFTIPKSSFNYSNLTYSWSYLGILDDATIPASVSATGSELTNQSAIVYIKFVGDDQPTDLNPQETALHYDNGWFVQSVIGYSHEDPQTGLYLKYGLQFDPTNDGVDIAGSSIEYQFKSEYYDSDGSKVGDKTDINLNSMLNGLNTQQVVYKGSNENPATAIAFHEGGFDLDVQVAQPKANIVMVLDTSGSMAYNIAGTRTNGNERLNSMKMNAINFINAFAYNTVTFGIVPFSYEGNSALANNTGDNKADLIAAVNALNADGSTNLGDGLRQAYYKFIDMPDQTAENFLLIITDGEYNLSTHLLSQSDYSTSTSYYNKRPPDSKWKNYFKTSNFYWGKGKNGDSVSSNRIARLFEQDDSYGKGYMEFCANKYDGSDFKTPTVFLINIKDLSDTSANAILAAFGVASSDYSKYIYKVSDSQSFVDSIGNVIDQINNSAWLLDGPKM
jgi:prepilin-type N-terminal cleavage/methylation domain-containing protein